MLEELIAQIIEKTIVGGAFIYLLHMFINKFSKTLDTVSDTMQEMSKTLTSMNERMGQVEARLDDLEGKGRVA